MRKRTWLAAGVGVIALVVGGRVRGQSSSILGYGFTAPVLALPGQTISVCAFNWVTGPVVAGPVTVTEEIVDVGLGGAVAQQSVTLPISAFDPSHSSPCVQRTVPAAATSAAGPGELISGAVVLYPPQTTGTSSDTTPPAVITASVNVSGSSVQTIPISIQSVASGSGSSSRPLRPLPEFAAP